MYKSVLTILGSLCLSAVAVSGSTVFSPITVSNGTVYTVSISTDTAGGADMAGMVITVNFNSGPSETCTWATISGNNGGCSGADFSINYNGTNTDPAVITGGGPWTISNTSTGKNITSVSINAIAGLVTFDRCTTGSSEPGTPDDSNPGFDCALGGNPTEGTPGSNVGFSVASATGGSNITATAAYTNLEHLSSQTAATAAHDLYGVLTLSWSSVDGSHTFAHGNTFTFEADTDKLASASADVTAPEPATLGLTGLTMVCLGLLRRRR
jgi:hypothetical protein